MRSRIVHASGALSGAALFLASAFADALFLSTPGVGRAQWLGMAAGAGILAVSCYLLLRPPAPPRRSPGRVLRAAAALTVVLAPLTTVSFILAATVAAAAAREKGVDFDFDRTTGPERVLRLARAVGFADVGVCRCVPDLDTSFVLPGGFRTGASVYHGRGHGARPAVLLIHGNTWLGRRLSTYRLKARLLADAGFTVLAYDQVGFGDADDRFQHGAAGLPAAYDFYGQASAALEFLMKLVPLDAEAGVTVMGHSGGVDAALYLGHANPAVSRVVIMVAPPPPMEGDNAQAERGAYFSARAAHTYRFIHQREWPDWFEWEMTQADESDPSELYRQDGHPPMLLVLGERDEPRGHPAVFAMYDEVAGPKDLAWLPRSDHYLNTAQSLGFVFFDRRVARDYRKAVVERLRNGFGEESGEPPARRAGG